MYLSVHMSKSFITEVSHAEDHVERIQKQVLI